MNPSMDTWFENRDCNSLSLPLSDFSSPPLTTSADETPFPSCRNIQLRTPVAPLHAERKIRAVTIILCNCKEIYPLYTKRYFECVIACPNQTCQAISPFICYTKYCLQCSFAFVLSDVGSHCASKNDASLRQANNANRALLELSNRSSQKRFWIRENQCRRLISINRWAMLISNAFRTWTNFILKTICDFWPGPCFITHFYQHKL